MKNKKHISNLLTLERVEVGETLNNITSVILVIMSKYGGLMMNKDVASKCIFLGFMVIQCFKPFTWGWSQKQWNKLLLISLVCIVWHIGPTW